MLYGCDDAMQDDQARWTRRAIEMTTGRPCPCKEGRPCPLGFAGIGTPLSTPEHASAPGH